MTKIVNSWNEWDPLKRVIVGRPEGTNIPAPEPAWWYDLPDGGYPLGSFGPFPQEMVDKANEQMDYFGEREGEEASGRTKEEEEKIHPSSGVSEEKTPAFPPSQLLFGKGHLWTKIILMPTII